MRNKLIFPSITITLLVLVITSLFLTTSMLLTLRSYLVMYPYSYIHKEESILNKHGITFRVPGGRTTRDRDWYPFMMTFNDDVGFSKYTEENLSLTILYNFGHFNFWDGASSYYDPNSPYFSSFYGGYAIYNHDQPKKPFGVASDGTIDFHTLSKLPEYDQTHLVLPSIGCPKEEIVFDSKIDSITYDVQYISRDGWVKIDSTITTNSPLHAFQKDHRGYIQYGKPLKTYYEGEDFPITSLKGRLYVNYIEEYEMTFVLYVLAPTLATIEDCDKNFLSKSLIKK